MFGIVRRRSPRGAGAMQRAPEGSPASFTVIDKPERATYSIATLASQVFFAHTCSGK
jgi:hypothetical protein